MNKLKIKYILTVSVFALLILGLGVAQLILPDKDTSSGERRELAQAPDVSVSAVFNRQFSDDLEEYLLDQFPGREAFRTVNSAFRLYLLRQRDANGIWSREGYVFKTETNTDTKQITYGANLYNSVIDTYLQDLNVYFSVVPDKNYFAAEKYGYPHLDYDTLYSIMESTVRGAEFIDIRDTLSLEKYYRTDTHWQQQLILPTVQRLLEGMGMDQYMVTEDEYTPHTLQGFKGVYMEQAALPIEPDTLTYMTSAYTDSATVTGPMYNYGSVYATDAFYDNMDGYDLFLGGTQPIIEIECPNARTDRELYIFRDSFGSSLSPLFTGTYKKITVIDLRYVTSAYLGQMVTFTPGSDALFINSTLILNTAMIMR